MKKLISLLAAATLLCGCASNLKYAPYPASGLDAPGVKVLGPVAADSGKWPLSLNVPPPDYTYYAALRDKAAGQYSVPQNQVVLGEVSVNYTAEVVGTIRSWKASAIAGQNTNLPPQIH
jgi:hypothetical protein